MLLLDITVVNVALPSIREDLDASFTNLQWVLDAYALTLAALVLTAGSLADRFGRRRVFAVGLAIFSLASLLCALAPDPTFLGLGWESIFYLNVPIGVAAIAISYLKLRGSRDPNATRVDWVGVATFSGALFLLVLALLRGNDEGWGSGLIVSLFAGSAALLLAFVAIERRVREPMLPLGLFRIPSFTGVQLAAFAVSGSLFAMFLYLTLYLQNYLGYSPFETGLRYLPITLLAFLFSAAVGALIGRVPARLLMSTGLALTGLGLLLMSGLEAGSEWTTRLGGFLVAGAGTGLLNPVIADVAVSVVPKERSGMAAGINDTRQVGIAVGIAVWGAIFVGRGAGKVRELATETPAASGERPRSSSRPPPPAASTPSPRFPREPGRWPRTPQVKASPRDSTMCSRSARS
jgi:predicted MFS family arabinose efflux permease